MDVKIRHKLIEIEDRVSDRNYNISPKVFVLRLLYGFPILFIVLNFITYGKDETSKFVSGVVCRSTSNIYILCNNL